MLNLRKWPGFGLPGAILGLASAVAIAAAPPAPSSSAEAALSLDDASWLFPAPTRPADMGNLISINDLTTPDPSNSGQSLPVWSDQAFTQFLQIADSDAAQVGGPSGPRIGIPSWARVKSVWFVAGVRIDAGAPGLSPAVMSAFGQRPQIRLILQPVQIGPDGSPHPADITAHLVFDFTVSQAPPASCPLFAVPDIASFKTVVVDAATLRDQLAAGAFGGIKVSTAGAPLGVHPGLANAQTAPLVKDAMVALLERHISANRLQTMALMGTPANQPAPWIFLSILRAGQTYLPVHGPTLDGTQFAMMFTGTGASPAPHTNNLAPMGCASAAFPPVPPIASRQGSSTSDVVDGVTNNATAAQVFDLVADPTRSHFFNTDCVSCHTETQRAMRMNIPLNAPGLSPAVVPSTEYVVRNFGWSPLIDGPVHSVATRRTANETAAVVAWINATLISQ